MPIIGVGEGQTSLYSRGGWGRKFYQYSEECQSIFTYDWKNMPFLSVLWRMSKYFLPMPGRICHFLLFFSNTFFCKGRGGYFHELLICQPIINGRSHSMPSVMECPGKYEWIWFEKGNNSFHLGWSDMEKDIIISIMIWDLGLILKDWPEGTYLERFLNFLSNFPLWGATWWLYEMTNKMLTWNWLAMHR